MSYCANCGQELNDTDVRCIRCGETNQQQLNIKVSNDPGKIWWVFIGIFSPIAGFIIYVIWRYERPFTAKKALIGMWLGIILIIFFYVLIFSSVILIESWDYYGILQ